MRISGASGYSFVELVLVLVLLSIVAGAIGTVLVSQRRFYSAQAQIVETRDALRTALEVLTGELRETSPVDGDLYAIHSDSVALRSFQGFGVVCELAASRLRLWSASGVFGSSGRDSALVFVENDPGTRADNGWRGLAVHDVRSPPGGGCTHGREPDLELVVGGDLSGVRVGAPIRGFRPYVYRLYSSSDGRWWLGQRRRDGRFQPVVGPFEAPGDGGLRFRFLMQDGAPAWDPSEVARVDIRVRGRSADRVALPHGIDFYIDSLSTSVYLRNAGIEERRGPAFATDPGPADDDGVTEG